MIIVYHRNHNPCFARQAWVHLEEEVVVIPWEIEPGCASRRSNLNILIKFKHIAADDLVGLTRTIIFIVEVLICVWILVEPDISGIVYLSHVKVEVSLVSQLEALARGGHRRCLSELNYNLHFKIL